MYQSDADRTKEAVQAMIKKGPMRLVIILAILFSSSFF